MKNLTITLAFSIICLLSFAQAPQGFEYQAVVRDANSNLLVNQAVGVQISINQGSASGTSVYQETFSTTTNLYGLVNLQIGTGTTGDDFSTIDWTTGPYFVEIGLDVTGGTNYTVMGASQLLSVPYALHAKTVEIDLVDDADNDPTNEIELPPTATIGDLLTWDGSNWVASPQNGGKTYLILSGDITDAEAVTKIANEFGPNTQFVSIVNTTNLTTVDLSGITELVDLIINNNSSLTSVSTPDLAIIFNDVSIVNNNAFSSINFPQIEKVFGSFNIGSNAALTSLSLPSTTFLAFVDIAGNQALTSLSMTALTSTKYFAIRSNAALASLSLPSLTSISQYFSVEENAALPSLSLPNLASSQAFSVSDNPSLMALSLPALTSSQNFSVSHNATLTSLSVPTLSTVGDFQITSNLSLASVALPSLTTTDQNLYIVWNYSLASVSLPAFTSCGGSINISQNILMSAVSLPALTTMNEFYSQSNALPSSQINNILAQLVAIVPPLTGKSISLSNQSPPAPPTGQGIIDKSTLTSNGNTVSTD